jgi:hypothetical protein
MERKMLATNLLRILESEVKPSRPIAAISQKISAKEKAME